jgi:ABC-type sugar transport system substrate-binding protein
MEASEVIGRRTMKIVLGGAAGEAEVRRMIAEKIDAGVALQTLALTGSLGVTPHHAAAKTLSHLRRKVRANRRRLSS